jgi:hypothetical protein
MLYIIPVRLAKIRPDFEGVAKPGRRTGRNDRRILARDRSSLDMCCRFSEDVMGRFSEKIMFKQNAREG